MKNIFLKLCSLILVTVLLANMLPVSALAEKFRETVANTETREEALQSVTAEDAYVVDEIEENRTEYTKEFLMSNGLHMATVYSNAVHYQTEGCWEEINNTLVTEGDGVLSNTAGVWDVNFPQQLTNTSSISVVKDGFALSFSPQGELTQGAGTVSTTRSSRNTVDMAINGTTQRFGVNTTATAAAQVQQLQLQNTENVAAVPSGNHSQLQYSHVYQDTHIVYDLDGNSVKESVILERYRSELQGYQYQLNAPDMIPVLQADNSIYFYDKAQSQIVMVMPAPFLIDDNGEYNRDVQVQLTGSNGNYILTYILPQQWLSAWRVVFPLRIPHW